MKGFWFVIIPIPLLIAFGAALLTALPAICGFVCIVNFFTSSSKEKTVLTTGGKILIALEIAAILFIIVPFIVNYGM